MIELRLELDAEARMAVRSGRFVRVDLPATLPIADASMRSVIVGRAGGQLRVFANVCRHHAIPLDLGADSPMSDDGLHLLCHQHGALYRPTDGHCVVGPCRGMKLFAIEAREEADAIVIVCP